MASAMMTRRVDHLLLIFCLAFCFGSISAAPCYNYSWIEVPSASVLNTTLNVTVSNASDCQTRCYNNLTCTGYALDTTIPNNTRCYFNFALTNSSNSGITYFRPDTNISYFSLLRDTPSCGLLDSNCSYMWKGQKDLHGFDGVEGNRSTLNGCVRLCQNTPNCTGVDWNQQDTNCWINFNSPVLTGNQPNITFFQRNCNDILPATTKATTPGPTTTSTSTTTTTLPTTTITTTTTTTTTPTTPNTTPTTAPTTIGSSCDGISCPPGKSCQLNSTNQPECLCNTACTMEYAPVCGSDGKTHDNRCALMVEACQTSNNITVDHDGQCIYNSAFTTTGPTAPQAIRSEFETYPMAIKPAYIVLAGLGGGCIVLVITAVVILCVYPLHKNLKYSTNSTVTTVHTHQPHTADNNSYEADEQERIDMDDMAEGEVKTYYNAEEVN